jgi:hypothetical protein
MTECADAARGLSIEDRLELIQNIKTLGDKECPPVEVKATQS